MSDSRRIQTLAAACRSALLPELAAAEERPAEAADCAGTADAALAALRDCRDFFESDKSIESLSDSDKKQLVVPVLLLCGEHASGSRPWSDARTIAAAFSALSAFRAAADGGDAATLKEVLVGDGHGLLRWVLEELGPKCAVESAFRRHPAAAACSAWLLHQVTRPHLSDHLNFFLPFSLCLLGDWEEANRLAGLGCLRHLVANVDGVDLVWYGRADLLASVLSRHQQPPTRTSGSVEVMDSALQVHLDMLSAISTVGRGDGDATCKMDETERLARGVIRSLEMEGASGRARTSAVLAAHLTTLVSRMGIRTARWMSGIFRACDAVLAHVDSQSAPAALLLLERTLDVDGLPVGPHCKAVARTLFRVLYETSKKEDCEAGWRKDLADRTCRCLATLKTKCPEDFSRHTRGLSELNVSPEFNRRWKDLTE